MRLLRYLLLFTAALPAQTADPLELFEKKIRPLLVSRCHMCHGDQVQMAGLNLSSASSFAQGGDSGAPTNQQNPSDSLLWKVVSYEERIKMPPTGKLSPEEIADLKGWIEAGAPWPGSASETPAVTRSPEKGITEEDRKHWAFQPVRDHAPPAVQQESWVRNPIDRFILARLEEDGLEPAPPAAKLTLLRRVTFDLTGLPPTMEEIAAFEADDSPEAFAQVIERLLASPRYGERWGRHWLDVARYADSTGMDENHAYPHAWRYRDYVIEAFNQDLPYDQFVRQQVAGDLLPPPPGETVNKKGIIATGFLALGPKPLAQQDRVKMVYDVIDEQVDTMSKAVLGLTVACARCHDHKFDPILTKDYYSLVAFFANTKNFRNYGRPGSVSYIHYTPLEPRKFESYQEHRESIWNKRLEMEEAIAEEQAARGKKLNRQVAAYLKASWGVLRQQEDPTKVAAVYGLERGVLEAWLCLLSESSGEHWQQWREADSSAIETVADEYEKTYVASAEKWAKRLADWRERYKTEAELDRNLPERPSVDAEEHPLFAEVAFEGGPFDLPAGERIKKLRAEWKRLENTLPAAPAMASAVIDKDEPVAQHVFIRGDHHNPGEPVPKRFPLVLAEETPDIPRGSGRLQLAEWMMRSDHPLTARVMVNRLWQWHFGEGLVRTPNNWGRTGEPPTHPKLLDFLARRFVESGWSVKAMHRLILLSNAYQMTTRASPAARENDPANRLWSHLTQQRLTVEAIRDSFLALDSSLDPAMGGNLMEGSEGKRPDIDPDDSLRRTVYIPVSRGSVPTLLSIFDFGDATTPSAGRPQTNVAPQALFMMNSRFAVKRAEGFARSLLDNAALGDVQRVEQAYLRALTRRPDTSEIDHALSYIAAMKERVGGPDARQTAWRSFCHVLMSSNEFLYLE